MKIVTSLLFISVFIQSFPAIALTLRPADGHITLECKPTPSGAPHVWIIKQWHADPSIDTHDREKTKALPQVANQTAIFRLLDQWIGKGEIKTLIAEGCSGELTPASKTKWNGWTVADLITESKKPHYDEIVASVPEKLEAKYVNKIHIRCGDDDALIREHLLAFSDIRGAYGFLSRLLQYKEDPVKARTYLEGVIDVYKLPPSTTMAEALAKLRSELSRSMARLHAALDTRNEKVIAVIQSARESEVAVVYGGLHAPGLVSLLEAKGIGCTVVEPTGYQNDEVELMKQLDAAVKSAAAS